VQSPHMVKGEKEGHIPPTDISGVREKASANGPHQVDLAELESLAASYAEDEEIPWTT
jgi:hypothetical protein